MKKCTWCGKEYPDTAERCAIDAQPLTGGAPPVPERAPATAPAEASHSPRRHPLLPDLGPDWRPTLINLFQIEGAFEFSEGFSRPDWRLIGQTIRQTVPVEKIPEAWSEAAIQWAVQVATDLGGEYGIRCSGKFILLSAWEAEAAGQLLVFAEQTLQKIEASLREAAWKPEYGSHVIFLFAEDDDYYQYVSCYYREGIHPTSGGCLIHRDYVHIALPCLDGKHIRQALAHELVHNSVVHLRLPLWLNEGLAVTFDRTAAAWPRSMLDHDLRDRHLAFWNPEAIQKFWSGVSFQEPGDANELSYSLAEILVHLLLSESRHFGTFVKQADWHDAGQTAAVEVLGNDLGQIAATFLGEGNWRPNRKAMVECWKVARRKDTANPPDDETVKE